MRGFCLTIFFLICVSASAQSIYNADSVEKIFETLPDSLRIREANHLMREYLDVDIKKSLRYANESFSLRNKVTNKQDIASTYINWAITQYNFARFDSCLKYNVKALKIYESLGDTTKMATAFNNISGAYNALGDHSSAVYYAYKAYLIHEAHKNWRKVAVACVNLSASYFEAKDYSSTLHWSRQGYDNYKKAGLSEDLGYAIQMYVDVYIARKQIDSAFYYLNEIKQLNRQYPNEYLETINMAQRGEVYALQGKYDSAILLQEHVVKFYEDMDMADGELVTRLSIASAYLKMRKLDEAERYAMTAYTRSTQIKNNLMILKSSTLLADVFKARNQFDRALQYAQIGAAYKDSIMMQSLKGSIEGRFFDVKLEHETQEKLEAIKAVEERNAIIGRQGRIIVLVSAGLIFMAVMAYLIRRAGRYRKRMNEQLTASNQRLSELNHEINGLVNTIVHDLKSPLNSVQGILSLIEMTDKNEETRSLVQMANKSLANGHDIIRQLLEIRELEEGAGKLTISSIDTEELINDIRDSFHPTAQQKKINLSVEADACKFDSDKVMVRRVLDNLVSNALKFSPAHKEVKISAVRENGSVIFRVSDQGPGFSDDDLQKIYGKFQKLSARPTAGENSNGLGLATVNILIKNLHGSIDLETSAGKGSVFVVKLKATREEI